MQYLVPIIYFGFCLWVSLYTLHVLFQVHKIMMKVQAGQVTAFKIDVKRKSEIALVLTLNTVLVCSFIILVVFGLLMEVGII